jgi:hypothetical protein
VRVPRCRFAPQRVANINQWTARQADAYLGHQFATREHRSQHDWQTDMVELAAYGIAVGGTPIDQLGTDAVQLEIGHQPPHIGEPILHPDLGLVTCELVCAIDRSHEPPITTIVVGRTVVGGTRSSHLPIGDRTAGRTLARRGRDQHDDRRAREADRIADLPSRQRQSCDLDLPGPAEADATLDLARALLAVAPADERERAQAFEALLAGDPDFAEHIDEFYLHLKLQVPVIEETLKWAHRHDEDSADGEDELRDDSDGIDLR